MRKGLFCGMVLVLAALLCISASATSAFAWSQSMHAYVAKRCLEIEGRYLLNYNARMGSIVPDFFWYLRDKGLIDEVMADKLHGDTTQACVVIGDTTYFYEFASEQLMPWNFLLYFFAEGIRAHVYADIKAHDTEESSESGYLEGKDMWVDTLKEKTELPEDYRDALHLALEFAVDALLVQKHGLLLADLLFSHRQANFLEETVTLALGHTPEFDVSLEFQKYLALMRVLEKAAALYAPYLISGKFDQNLTGTQDLDALLDAERELSEDSLDIYTQVFMILLEYPEKIYDTLTEQGMHWEDNALPDILNFWITPCYITTESTL